MKILGCAFCKYHDLTEIYHVYICYKHHTFVSIYDRDCNDFIKEKE